MRQCGGCTLCCKLVPVEELAKPAGKRCKHQRFERGCMIYAKRPLSCREWSCMWLIGVEAGIAGMATELPLGRPDRTHYVVDITPDFIRLRDNVTGEIAAEVMAIQIWVDPKFPDAWQDKDLLDLLEREQLVALVRYGRDRAFALAPPSRSPDGKWQKTNMQDTSSIDPELEERRAALRAEFFWNQAKEQRHGSGADEKAQRG